MMIWGSELRRITRGRQQRTEKTPGANGKYFIGIQGAARNAVLAAADREGRVRGVVKLGPLALRVNAEFRQDFLGALGLLAEKLGLVSVEALAARTARVCIAMSGVRESADVDAVSQVLEEIWFTGNFDRLICEDIWSVLAADGADRGCAILSSTGANVLIRNTKGDFVTVGGWGSDLADLGSGYHIGKLALNLVLDSADGRRDVSERFVAAVLRHLQLSLARQVVPWFHEVRKTSHWRPSIADLANVVTRLAEEDEPDEDAKRLLRAASHELLISIAAAFRQAQCEKILELEDGFAIVLDGGVLRNSPFYRRRIASALRDRTLKAHTRRGLAKVEPRVLRRHPVVGTLGFAISGGRRLPKPSVFENLVQTSETLPELQLHVTHS